LRTARFFPEADDDPELRRQYTHLNLKVNEYLYRRLDLADAVEAHILAVERGLELGFARYVLSSTSPFERQHLSRLREDAPSIVSELFLDYEDVYQRQGWRMLPSIDRVYINQRARDELGWKPRFDFRKVLNSLKRGDDVFSPLARRVGSKGYHSQRFEEGPYPVEREK